ncbi:MAG: tetratricopeptide repeat protein, partial [Burkholderiaceae bacterium]
MKKDKIPGPMPGFCKFIMSVAAVCVVAILLAGCELFLDADARVERAAQRIAQHDYAAAEIELRNALQSQADHAQARLLLARVLLRRGELADAQRELERATQAGVPATETVELTAKLRLASGQPRELLAQLDAGELSLPAPLDAVYRGRALLDIQQPEQAQDVFEQALQAHPASVKAAAGLAMARAAQGELA